MKNLVSKILFVAMEVFLISWLVLLFVTPTRNVNIDSINFEKLFDAEKKEKIDKIFYSIRNNNLSVLVDDFSPEIENIEAGLEQIDRFFLNNNLKDEKLIHIFVSAFNSITGDRESWRKSQFIYSVTLEQGYGIINIDILETGGITKILTFNVNQLEKPIEEHNRFYEQPMNFIRIFLLLMVLAVFIFLMYTVYDCYKLKSNKKILFQIFLPISALAFTFNWSSISLNISLLSFSITPVTLIRAGIMEDWRLTFYLPILAIIYWVKFRKKQKALTEPEHVA